MRLSRASRYLISATLSLTLAAASTLVLASASSAAQSVCPAGDVYFIGARGSGESTASVAGPGTDGMGSKVGDYYANRLKPAVEQAGLDLRSTYVPYPARPVSAIEEGLNPLRWGDNTVGVKSYMAGVDEGVVNLQNLISSQLDLIVKNPAACRNSKIVLSGYSQGALVVHRLLKNGLLGAGSVFASHFGGAFLLADPEFSSSDAIQKPTPVVPFRGEGIALANPRASGSNTKAVALSSAVYSVCIPNDIVCDYTFARVAGGVTRNRGTAIHTSYYTSNDPSAWYDTLARSRNFYGYSAAAINTGLIRDAKPPVTTPPPATQPSTSPPPTSQSTTPRPPDNPTEWTVVLKETGCGVTANVNRKTPPNLPEKGWWFLLNEAGAYTNSAPWSDGKRYRDQAVLFTSTYDYRDIGPGGTVVKNYLAVESGAEATDPGDPKKARRVLTISWTTPTDGRCSETVRPRVLTAALS